MIPLVCLLLGLEIVCRLFRVDLLLGVRPNPVFTEYDTYIGPHLAELEESLYTFDSELMYRLKPLVDKQALNLVTGSEYWHLSVNDRGFRHTSNNQNGTRPVLLMGDSITFGLWVSDDDTFASQAQLYLNQHAPELQFKLINAGVPGYDSMLGLIYMRQLLEKMKPEVVVLGFGMNDQMPKSKPRKEVLESFHRTAWLTSMLNRSEFCRTLRRIISHHNQPDESTVALLGIQQVSPDDFHRNVEQMILEAQAAGVRIVLLSPFIPQWNAEYERIIATLASQYRIPLVDARVAVCIHFDCGAGKITTQQLVKAVMVEDVHPNPLGHRLIGQMLGKALVELSHPTH